jgi:hypothetical protein
VNRCIAVAAIALVAAGCGRREERAWFDAPRAAAPLALAAKALPGSSLRVRWTPPAAPREIQADAYFSLPVTLTNIGDVAWPDRVAGHPQKRDGSFAVRVTHAWTHGSDRLNARAGAVRTDLPRSVAPGETITVVLELHAPAQPGEYQLVVELIQELVQWFSDVGADSLTIPCRVVAAAGAGPRPVP